MNGSILEISVVSQNNQAVRRARTQLDHLAEPPLLLVVVAAVVAD